MAKASPAKYADRKLSQVDKELKKTYRQAQKELKEKLADFNAKFAEKSREKKRQLAEGEITEKEYKDWLTGQVFVRSQFEQNLRQVNAVMLDHNRQAMNIINSGTLDTFAESYNFEAFKTEAAIMGSFSVYNAQSVARLILEEPDLLPKWKIDEPKDYKWNASRVNNIIRQGIIQGEGVAQITDRLCEGLATSNYKKMRMFARTALGSAQEAGRQKQMDDLAGMGVKVMKRWLATLDGVTRDSHRALDGDTIPYNEHFANGLMFPKDPSGAASEVFNCRCSMRTFLPDYDDPNDGNWRENEVIDGQTYEEWKKGKIKKGEVQSEGEPRIKPITKDDPMKDIKQMIMNHNGEWSYNDLHKLGGMVFDKIDIDSDPLIKDKEWYSEQRETIRGQIADLRKKINDLDMEKKYDEADKLEKKLHELEQQREGFSDLYWATDKKIRDNATKKVLDTLSSIREFGGVTKDNLNTFIDTDHFKTQKKQTRERSIEALNYYPKAWLDASAADKRLCAHWTTGRAYYQHYYYNMAEIRFAASLSTNIHELGHRMERSVPAILKAEREFYDMRTNGEKLEWLGAGYCKKEKTRRDHFYSPYMGKDYGGDAYELVSMGFQHIFTNYEGFKKNDPDMLKWSLGLLAGI